MRSERWDLITAGMESLGRRLADAAQGNAHQARAAHDDMKEQLKTVTATARPVTVAELNRGPRSTLETPGVERPTNYSATAPDMEAALIHTEPPSYSRLVVDGWAATALALTTNTWILQ